jgi:hypothetical protein
MTLFSRLDTVLLLIETSCGRWSLSLRSLLFWWFHSEWSSNHTTTQKPAWCLTPWATQKFRALVCPSKQVWCKLDATTELLAKSTILVWQTQKILPTLWISVQSTKLIKLVNQILHLWRKQSRMQLVKKS